MVILTAKTRGFVYETTISTFQDPPQTAARLFKPQLDQERARHSEEPAPRRSPASDPSLISMADEGPSLGLPRSARLKKSREFLAVREEGQRLASGCLIANWKLLPAGSGSRVGVVTSRRVGSAVARSLARRLLREAFRLHQHHLDKPVAMVLVARPSIAGKRLAAVERDFLRALRQACLLKKIG